MSSIIQESLPKGTVEHIIVDVKDRLENVTDLATATPKFDTRAKNSEEWIQQGIVATAIGMRVFCLIDTTLTAYVTDEYEMFVYFVNLPESPRLGPIRFRVDA